MQLPSALFLSGLAEVLGVQPRLLRRAVELVTNAGRKHPDEIISDLRLSPYLIEAFCNLSRETFAGHGPQISFEPTLK
jgi:hypothetical protein